MYHVLNRAAGKIRLFRDDEDFEAFERVMIEAHERHPIRILSYCVLPNHWHFVVWPKSDGEVTNYFRWLGHTHAMRWRVAHKSVGLGPLYQGRFKCFPVQDDGHLLAVLRYVEQNALGPGFVKTAEQWRWGGLWARRNGDPALKAILAPWPIKRPADWLKRVNAPLSAKELPRLRTSIDRSQPYGEETWVNRTAAQLGLEHTLRSEGRPPKRSEGGEKAKN